MSEPDKAGSPPPKESGAVDPPVGGDTVRLRVDPATMRGKTRPFRSAPKPEKSPRRLPDIRGRRPEPSKTVRSGPFSFVGGFVWLVLRMIFFTMLVMGLCIGIGYVAMAWYFKPPTVDVPNVRGMKIADAFEVLSEKNLGIIKLRSESSGLFAPGEIIEQSPPAGSQCKVKRAVGVVISSGRSKFVVPNVMGESRESALNKIKGAGLEVGSELKVEDANVPRECVINQTPSGGTGLDAPVKVDLLISSGPPGSSLSMPDLAGRTVDEARAALNRLGVTDVVVEPAEAAGGDTVQEQEPLTGKVILQTDHVVLRTGKSSRRE